MDHNKAQVQYNETADYLHNLNGQNLKASCCGLQRVSKAGTAGGDD